jgi:hypothetical protein
MICPACKAEIPASSLYCFQCGNHLTTPRHIVELPAESLRAIRFINIGSILCGFGLVVALSSTALPFLGCAIGGAGSIGCYASMKFYETSLPIVVTLGVAVFLCGLGMMMDAPRLLSKTAEKLTRSLYRNQRKDS